MEIEIFKRLEEIKNEYERKRAEENLLKEQIKTKTKIKEEKIKENEDLLTLKMLLDDSSKEARQQGKDILSEVATLAVQSVFGDNIWVDIKISYKDGIPNAEVVCYKKYNDKIIEIDPANRDGGGLADIVSLAMLMALREINGSENFAPNFLDEPSKYVSAGELSEKFSAFMQNMVPYTGQQYIVSTHDKALIESGDTVYKMILDKDTGISHATKELF